MAVNEQKSKTDQQEVSVLARDKTFGERIYDITVGYGLNFWVNLLVSAAFSLWVAHGTKTVNVPGLNRIPFIGKMFDGSKTPRDIQRSIGNGIERQFFMQGITDPERRMARSQSMATVLTLLTPGHFIMIPSTWLGAKIKPAFVKFFDRMHYGEAGMEDPSLKHRHQQIEQARRPTFFGAAVGRLGTVFATQVVARTVGTEGNIVNKLGNHLNMPAVSSWKGVDNTAENIGELLGNDVERILPKQTASLRAASQRAGMNWSYKQQLDPTMDTSGPYNRVLQDYGRYMGQDVLYTAITAGTMSPIMSVLKKFIPGMSYQPKMKAEASTGASRSHAETPARNEERASDTPRINVSDIKKYETVTAAETTRQAGTR